MRKAYNMNKNIVSRLNSAVAAADTLLNQNITKKKSILEDTFGRYHNYLRISLTERCNLRCKFLD
jgi:cyclic pyranopterin phosphate synthase